jgi:hypothetical protein
VWAEKEELGVVVRDTTLGGGGVINYILVINQLVLLIISLHGLLRKHSSSVSAYRSLHSNGHWLVAGFVVVV